MYIYTSVLYRNIQRNSLKTIKVPIGGDGVVVVVVGDAGVSVGCLVVVVVVCDAGVGCFVVVDVVDNAGGAVGCPPHTGPHCALI